jgi:hypothetical protein
MFVAAVPADAAAVGSRIVQLARCSRSNWRSYAVVSSVGLHQAQVALTCMHVSLCTPCAVAAQAMQH